MIRCLSAVALCLLSAASVAGPVNPPAGAVGPTMKPLNEVEPRTAINATNTPGDADSVFKITQPGSYYLTGNVQGAAGKSGIEVAAGNVTIDLNGFNLTGPGGSLTGVNAYQVSRVVVKNGTLSNWGGRGVVIGAGGTVSGVTVDHCGGPGVETTAGCVVDRCGVIACTSGGFVLDDSSSATACVAIANGGAGFTSVGAANFINCSATQNSLSGFNVLQGSTVRGCTARLNGYDGITADTHCTVTDNSCNDNGDDGIEVGSFCVVNRNTCSNNDPSGDGGGVYTFGIGSRIEENTLVGNRYGLNVGGSDNFIAKNICRANTNTNFNVLGPQEFAPVVTNPGTNGFATMTPWSNVAY